MLAIMRWPITLTEELHGRCWASWGGLSPWQRSCMADVGHHEAQETVTHGLPWDPNLLMIKLGPFFCHVSEHVWHPVGNVTGTFNTPGQKICIPYNLSGLCPTKQTQKKIRVMNYFPFTSTLITDECLVRSQFPLLPFCDSCNCASNQIFCTNPMAVSVERAKHSLICFISAGEMGGWIFMVSFPLLWSSLITDHYT